MDAVQTPSHPIDKIYMLPTRPLHRCSVGVNMTASHLKTTVQSTRDSSCRWVHYITLSHTVDNDQQNCLFSNRVSQHLSQTSRDHFQTSCVEQGIRRVLSACASSTHTHLRENDGLRAGHVAEYRRYLKVLLL
jgi:hypothetical protein